MSFIGLVIIILVLLLIFQIFPRYIAPWLIKRSMQKFKDNIFRNQENRDPMDNQREGRITIHRVDDKKNNDIPKDLGEYIDYEELNNQKPTDE